MTETTFSSLTLSGWRQFAHVDIELHPQLTIITGANGAGKSTILRIFSRHLGFDKPYLATPVVSKDGKGWRYVTGLFASVIEALAGVNRPATIGTLVYSNSERSELRVPQQQNVQYGLDLSRQESVFGTHIDSHQAVSSYEQIGQIPMTAITAEQAFNSYTGEVTSRFQGNWGGHPTTFRLKEALISMALLGAGNEYVPGVPGVLKTYTGFVDVLRSILPPTLGFRDLAIRPPEVVIVTETGEFIIDAASGGVATLIDIAWRLHTFSQVHDRFVVTMDEPENHLHPSMQRSLMGRLTKAFPHVQFIVATHSPFVVSSVRESNVYVLRYKLDSGRVVEGFVPEAASSRVVSEKLSWVNKAGSADDVLREVLGVPATMPEWAEVSLEQIVREFRNVAVTEQSLLALRGALQANGFDDYYPEALAKLLQRQPSAGAN